MSQREKATKKAVELLSKFDGYNDAVKSVEKMLYQLTDEQFHQYMEQLRDGQQTIPYIAPNLGEVDLTSEKNLKIAEELGHDFFERLWLTDPSTGETYLTNDEYLVIDLPIKRLQQHLAKKIRIPDNNRRVDERTGQVVGTDEKGSKGSAVSFPEFQVLYSQGLNETIRELFQFRGGDMEGYRDLEREAIQNGQPSLDAVDSDENRVRSSEILSVLLKAAHIDNNL